MANEECKTDHSKVTTKCCPDCGEVVRDPDDDRISSLIEKGVTSALLKHGLIKEEKPAKKTTSIADAFSGKGKEK